MLNNCTHMATIAHYEQDISYRRICQACWEIAADHPALGARRPAEGKLT